MEGIAGMTFSELPDDPRSATKIIVVQICVILHLRFLSLVSYKSLPTATFYRIFYSVEFIQYCWVYVISSVATTFHYQKMKQQRFGMYMCCVQVRLKNVSKHCLIFLKRNITKKPSCRWGFLYFLLVYHGYYIYSQKYRQRHIKL